MTWAISMNWPVNGTITYEVIDLPSRSLSQLWPGRSQI